MAIRASIRLEFEDIVRKADAYEDMVRSAVTVAVLLDKLKGRVQTDFAPDDRREEILEALSTIQRHVEPMTGFAVKEDHQILAYRAWFSPFMGS